MAAKESMWAPVLVAIIGLVGSIAVAYITTGRTFDAKFSAMEASIKEAHEEADAIRRQVDDVRESSKQGLAEAIGGVARAEQLARDLQNRRTSTPPPAPAPYTSGYGYLIAGDTLVQWGVAQSEPKTYKVESFDPPFAGAPTVVCSADGAYENKAFCNVANVTKERFAFFALSPEKYFDASRSVHWMAIGKKR